MKFNTTPKTVEELRAILDERKPYTDAISAAFRRGDMAGVEKAQKALRQALQEA